MNKATLTLALAAALSCSAFAHGDAKPLYGGIVQVASDVHYELVRQPKGVALYVVDHGKPVDASRMSGKLTVLSGAQKTEAELQPVGGNKLEAAQALVAPGARVVATLKYASGKTVAVRFSVK
jgi:hypothetical protein